MMTIWLTTLLFLPMVPPDSAGMIAGRVVNGSDDRTPIARAEVVLRAGQDGTLTPIATVRTDANGRFAFVELDADPTITYLPGANLHEIHYPGSRIRLDGHRTTANVELVAYNTVETPSPLVVRQHLIALQVQDGALDVTESMTIDNPTSTTYVGETRADHPTVTLRLRLPPGFETVTFEKEFHGRSFLVHDNTLVTDQPWTPGKRDLKFAYRLPIEQRSTVLRRSMDLPTYALTVLVSGQDAQQTSCDLPTVRSSESSILAFGHQGAALPAGHTIHLRLGQLPVSWERYIPWIAVTVLAILLAGTFAWQRRRQVTRLIDDE